MDEHEICKYKTERTKNKNIKMHFKMYQCYIYILEEENTMAQSGLPCELSVS